MGDDTDKRIDELFALFDALHTIVDAEGERSLARSLEGILAIVSEAREASEIAVLLVAAVGVVSPLLALAHDVLGWLWLAAVLPALRWLLPCPHPCARGWPASL